jgi:GNAT superfamily N-acetyltransferase
MQMLERAENLQDILDNIPDMIMELPDIRDEDSDITIRLAVPEDALDMAEIGMRSWEVAYKDIIPADFIREKNATRLEQYKRIITDENANHYVIQKHGKTVGIMWIAPSPDDDMGNDCYDVHAVYLHPDYFRQGIGKQAMDFAFDKARSLGKTIITVWVLEENIDAIRFYEKCGFKPDGKSKPREYGKTLTLIRMRRDL